MHTAHPLRLALLLALSTALPRAHADGARFAAPTPLYQQECGACHVAYPPALLPSASWQRVLGGLGQHYGSDASLEASTLAPLRAYLQANAGSYRRVREEPPQERITRSAWFLREHREGEIPPEVWKRASVRSPAQCAACHRGAAEGDFGEPGVRIPR